MTEAMPFLKSDTILSYDPRPVGDGFGFVIWVEKYGEDLPPQVVEGKKIHFFARR